MIVADDDVVIRGVLRACLTRIKQEVLLAENGLEALRFARNLESAMVILDLNMPGLNGLVACQRLRLLPGYAWTPVVILTGIGDERARSAALRAGATAFLTKPFDLGELMSTLCRFLVVEPELLSALNSDARQTGVVGSIAAEPGNSDGVREKEPAGGPEPSEQNRMLARLLRR